MMKHISVTDTTIRQAGKAAGYTLSFREKIELAKLLDRLGVSVIELHAVENPKIDSLLIKSVASAVKESAVCVPVALDPASVSLVWAALKEAKHPRIQVPAPVSAVQMEYLAGKKPAAMLEAIRQTVAAARAVCEDVEFLADDATRADPAFLAEALQTAIAAGAAGVTVCDAAGNMLPDAFGSFVRGIYEAVPQTKDVRFGVSCSDALSMADACAWTAPPRRCSRRGRRDQGRGLLRRHCEPRAHGEAAGGQSPGLRRRQHAAVHADEPPAVTDRLDVSDGPQPALAV